MKGVFEELLEGSTKLLWSWKI